MEAKIYIKPGILSLTSIRSYIVLSYCILESFYSHHIILKSSLFHCFIILFYNFTLYHPDLINMSTEIIEISYICQFCNKEFKSLRSLGDHLNIHSGVKPYDCSTCGKTFHLRSARNSHQLTHHGSRVVCEHCQRSYRCNYSLRRHQRTIHGINVNTDNKNL